MKSDSRMQSGGLDIGTGQRPMCSENLCLTWADFTFHFDISFYYIINFTYIYFLTNYKCIWLRKKEKNSGASAGSACP